MALVEFKDLPNTTTPLNAENLNKIQEANKYSTDEIEIGQWVDGKPIYRKVIRITLTTTQQSTSINVNNVSKIISFGGVTNTGLPINFYFQPANTFISTFVDTNNIYNICSSGYSGNTADVILEYTKTTD